MSRSGPSWLFRLPDLRWLLPWVILGTIAGHAASLLLCYFVPGKARSARALKVVPGEVELVSYGRHTVTYNQSWAAEMFNIATDDRDRPSWPRGSKVVQGLLTADPMFIEIMGQAIPVYEQELGFPWPELYFIGVMPGVTVSGPPGPGFPPIPPNQTRTRDVSIPLRSIGNFKGQASTLLSEPIGGRFMGANWTAACLNTCAYSAATGLALACGAWALRARRGRRGRCPFCAYDLAGLPPNAPCPECGERPKPMAIAPSDAGVPKEPTFQRIQRPGAHVPPAPNAAAIAPSPKQSG